MYLLYADDSGSPKDAKQQYFVLGGIAIFERQAHWISLELEKIAAKIDPENPSAVEFHGSPMLNGRETWKYISADLRVQTIKDCLGVLASSKKSTSAFCIAVKKSTIPAIDPVEWAFKELCKRFDHFLKMMYRDARNGDASIKGNHASEEAQRGIMILDETTKETSLQRLTRDFRTIGHSSGIIRNLVEVPLFVDSKATRLMQLADLVAYSTFRLVERGDSRFHDVFSHRFHEISGIQHGLCIKSA